MSDDNMKTVVHVDSVSDTSGVDRMLARIKALQATVAKMTKTPTTGLTESLNASVKKARELGNVLGRHEAESAANLRRRLGAEKRIWAQSARETEQAAKAQISASGRVAAAKAKDAKILDRAMRRDEDARFADGARALRAKVLGVKLAALAESKASEDAAKRAESALVKRFAFEDRMRRQRTREEASAARETARVEARTLADRERARAAETRRRASAWGDVRRGGQTALTRGRETYSGAAQIGRQVLVGTGAAVAAGIRGIAGRMAVDAAETSLKIFGDDGGKKFTSKRIAEIRREWLDSAALDTANTSADAIKAFTELNKSGVKDPKGNTELLLKAQAGLELDTAATSKLMGLVDRNLGAASTPARMKSVLNAIGVAAREDPTNAPEIVEGMRRGFGAISLGNMSPEHLAGLVSGAQSVGVQPGKAGTFIATLMKDLTSGSYAKGQRGKDLNEAARALGFGSAKGMARSASTDSTATILRVLERLERMPELQRSKVTNRLSQTQWSDENLQLIQGLGGLKKTLAEIDDKKNANFLDDASNERMQSWEKQWARSKAIFGRFWEAIGTGFDGIFQEVNRYFYDSAKRYDFGRISANVKGFLEGFVRGLGFDNVTGLLESVFGKPGDQSASMIEQWKAFGRGLATGLKSIFDAVRGLLTAFTGGSTDPEVIGRLTGRIIGLSAALLVLSPVITVMGALASGVLAVAAALRFGRGVLELATGDAAVKAAGSAAGVAGAGAGAAAGAAGAAGKASMLGKLGGILGVVGLADMAREQGALKAPDMSKGFFDAILRFLDPGLADRVGGNRSKTSATEGAKDGALEQRKPGQGLTQREIKEIVKQRIREGKAKTEEGGTVESSKHAQEDLARNVGKLSTNLESIGARLQLASFQKMSFPKSEAAARAAGTAGEDAENLGTIRESGGSAAMLGAIPGEALPSTGFGRRGIIGGGGSSDTASPDQKSGGSRSWRNNNPGNIEFGAFARSMGAIGSDGRFAKFPSYEAGRKAQEKLLFESKGYKDLTVGQAIRRWAPASENNVPAYIAAMGGDGSKRMSEYSPEQRAKLLDAMQRHEGWKAGTVIGGNPVTAGAAGNAVDTMSRFLGKNEYQDRGELSRFVGHDVAGSVNAWCARMVNSSLASVGIKGSGSAVANSFQRWGVGVDAKDVTKGDVLLDPHGKGYNQTGGHVGLATGRTQIDPRTGRLMVERIAGNESDSVKKTWVDASKLMVRRAERALAGKPDTYGRQDIGDGLTSTGWRKADANALAEQSPAEKLARSAPKLPQAGGAGGGGAKVSAPIHIHSLSDPQGTANAVQRRIQDVSGYHTQDRSYESI
ncbi:hypothetical protein ACFZ8E_19150 [Methylobacterium sp. HMF5984]|uniref:hypothetical protein n=1 Tax=Methylobacterium sp. HMF5984 TaxID=3367370 RepID=UPI003853CB36